MNEVEVLYGAADRVESRGLWQEGRWCSDGGTCVSNAISDVAHGFAAGRLARIAFGRQVGLDVSHYPALLGHIFRWNDTPGRTKAEVVAALRDAAVTAEAQAIVSGALSQPVAVFEVAAK